MTHDPQRWLDPDSEASDALRAVLASAEDDATPEQRDRLEARLGAALGWGAAGAAAGTATGVAAAKGGLLKIALASTAALVVSAGVGVLGYRALRTPEASPPAVDAPAERNEDSRSEQTPQPVETVAENTPPEEAVPPDDVTAADPALPEAPTPRRRAQPREPSDQLASEVALLGEVQRTVDDDPRRALRLLAQHRRRFPRGTLRQEREFFTVQALWASGQRRAARVRARRFLETYPRSTHAPRVRRIIAEE